MKSLVHWIIQPLLILLLSSLLACSNQWREADPGITDGELLSLLDTAVTQSSSSGYSVVNDLLDGEFADLTAIYFTEAPGNMGSVASVLSMMDLGFVDGSLRGSSVLDVIDQIEDVKVFFLDGYQSDQRRRFVLITQVKLKDRSSAYTSVYQDTGGFSVDTGEAVIELSNGSSELIVSTFDFDKESEELDAVVQLRLSEYGPSGEEEFIGKFSTLAGFGG